MPLTPRDRLRMALAHREPDRVPFDLGSTQVTSIASEAQRRLRARLGLPEARARVSDRVQQLDHAEEDLLRVLGVDTRGLWPWNARNAPVEETDDGTHLSHVDEWGLTYRIRRGGAFWYDLAASPLAGGALTRQRIDAHPWPRGDDPRQLAHLRAEAEAHRRAGYAVVLKSLCAGLFEMAQRLRGMEAFLMDLVESPVEAGHLLDRVLEAKRDYWRAALAALGDLVDVTAEGDDYGTQQSMLVSPATFRSVFKPRLADLVRAMKQGAPEAFVFFHSCGSVRKILPDFIEIGIDVLNPVQTTAAGMEPVALKRDFGKDVSFWGGGVDTQAVLPRGNPAEVTDDVRRNVDALAPGGGFVFCTVHNIQADVPPDNVVAMVEALRAAGGRS
ncbi:MAG TPA: uroporphyrinogen decarboxylase family protein [Vicinamibacteria bacterium]|nr:uroporphyrinogen decarboxylase family protein [Vicinamibacteria bacterium]